MASKSGKPEKSLQEKFKQWFKGGKHHPASISSGALSVPPRSDEILILTADVVNELSSESPLPTRLKVIKELTNAVRDRRLQDHGVELLWMKTKDLLDSSRDANVRHVALFLYVGLVTGQYQKLDVMRAHLFRAVELRIGEVEDMEPVLLLLDALTRQGKEILHFEEKIGPFLLRSFPLVIHHEHLHDFLLILLNMIKFNPAYLDPEVVCGLIGNLSQLTLLADKRDNVDMCLQCLYAIMGYSYIPTEALPTFIRTLCRVVNIKEHCDEAWRIMGSLMATHLGHSALYNLCQTIQQMEYQKDLASVRGAICFVGLSLWGSKSIKSMEGYSPMTILPTFVRALDCKHHLITYEVTLQLERLVVKRGENLRAPGCDCALDLIEALLEIIPTHSDTVQKEIYDHLDETITRLEALSEDKLYRGSKKKLFDIIDLCAKRRPESSVIRLIDYRATGLFPTKPAWIRGLHELMEKHYKGDTRDVIRVKCLQVMTDVVKANRHMYEEDLLERVVSPFLKPLDCENSMSVRLEGLKGLSTICCECSSSQSVALLDIFERVISKPLEKRETFNFSASDNEDIRRAIQGLVQIFRAKLCQQPAVFVVRIYNILSRHLEDNYKYPNAFVNAGAIRIEIYRLFLAFRANETFHLGLCDEESGVIRYSPYVVCREIPVAPSATETVASGAREENEASEEQRPKSGGGASSSAAQQPPSTLTYLSLTRACMMVIRTLHEERDWNVLKMILSKVPTVLQNKAIITRYGKAIHQFVLPLVELTSRNNRYPENLVNAPPNFSRSDFHNHVFPVLAAMASYNEYLESSSQKSLISALHLGLLSRECNRACIVALTACALEMKKSMYHLIPQVLLNFSKISATKPIATPMLEFLSTLIRLPDIFSSFTDTNYMSVFAIALPFTNPFKFDAYTVSLAHHVIIMWFLKCRLAYRQNFVQFIINALNANVLQSFDESSFRKSVGTPSSATGGGGSPLNMDSSDRKRSSSLSENTARIREQRHSAVVLAAKAAALMKNREEVNESQAKMNKIVLFHQELTETCVDILARYMFANTAVLPKRLPTSEFLLRGGNSATWLLNTMLITVTTSHCDQNANRGGLCDRCHLICSKGPSGGVKQSGEEEGDLINAKKRHQSEFQAQRPSPSRYLPGNSAKDDYILRRQLSAETLAATADDAAPMSSDVKKQVGEMGKLESVLHELKETTQKRPDLCGCWCTGWAEIYVRRPSGDVSWMCRIQNSSLISDSHGEFPLGDLSNLFQPSLDPSLRNAEMSLLDPSKRIPVDNLSGQEYDLQYEALTSNLQEQTYSIYDKLALPPQDTPIEPTMAQEGFGPKTPVKKTASLGETRKQTSSSKEEESPDIAELRNESAGGGGGGGGNTSRQSCNPINEEIEDEDDQQQRDLLRRRRISLQFGGGDIALPSSPGRQQLSSPLRSREATPPVVAATSAVAATSLVNTPTRMRAATVTGGIRDRAQTVSGPSPRKLISARDSGIRRGPDFMRSQTMGSGGNGGAGGAGGITYERAERVTGISPQFVFLQLYHSSCFGVGASEGEKPILLPATRTIETSIRNLDRIHAHETHKIGVLYIGPGQEEDESAILLNEFGSLRYTQFLHGLGSLISLKDIDKSSTYSGGLDYSDGDGDFAYMWEDDVMQVIFHTATLMPNRDNDPNANKKKRHIGNDFVAIVYNNSEGHYKLGTVKGQFIYACIVIIPLDQGSNKVFIECRPELDEPLGHVKETKIVSDRNLAILVRQLALHCNLAAQIQKSLGSGRDPYSSNCLERLRQIKRIKEKMLNEEKAMLKEVSNERVGGGMALAALNDFTNVVLRRSNKEE